MALHRFIAGASAAAVAGIVLAGCVSPAASGPEAPPLPARWSQPETPQAAALAQDWWRGFDSAELDALVAQALAQSQDLAAAAARVRQAEASARAAGAPLLPQLQAGFSSRREGRLGGQPSVDGSAHGASLSASYEVDLWGRLRAARDSAQASVRASRHDLDTVRLTLTAGVASGWLQAVGLRERIAIAELNLQRAQRLLGVVDSRQRAGAATALELAQQRALVAAQQRALAALRQQAADADTAVALLLGRAGAQPPGRAALAGLVAPAARTGLPSELLLRRPDLARAEARLAAADADLAEARAALLPRLDLSAGVATGASRIAHALDNPAYTLAAALAAPIFDGGRLAAGRELAQARREELLADYRQAIVAAFADVETALNATARLDEQLAAQAEERTQAERALSLSESRWRAGAESLLVLLDAQRTLYAAQDQEAQLRLARLQASVGLYKALGGGWARGADGPA